MKQKHTLLRIPDENPFKALRKILRTRGRKYFYENSRIGKEVIKDPGSWKALDLIYGDDPEEMETGTFTPRYRSDRMFSKSGAAKATRMRLEEYKKIMKILGPEYAELNGGKVNILSLASGPGRDIIEVTEYLGVQGIDVHATCVDKCPEAIELGSKIAELRGLSEKVSFKRKRFGVRDHYRDNTRYDIVITQGILDYLSYDRAISLLENAWRISKDGGTLVTSNMNNHRWMRFWMEFFGEWRLNYRNANELSAIIKESGYEDVTVYLLPEGFHWMGIGKISRNS